MAQRGRRHPKTMKLARRKAKRLKTIAGKILRDLERRLLNKKITKHQEKLELCHRVLRQKKEQSDKVYSLHEPHIYCISKGKEHKKYEFGCKASVAMTKTSGILVGAFSLKENRYDGHTLPEVLSQTKALTGMTPKKVIADKGYRGARWIGETEILTPRKGPEDQSLREKKAMQKRFRRRCAIEPVIGHLKSDFRMARNFLKGAIGDSMNVMLAAAAWNFKKWMRLASLFISFLESLIQTLFLNQSLKKSF
jgi:IS5 family transposase